MLKKNNLLAILFSFICIAFITLVFEISLSLFYPQDTIKEEMRNVIGPTHLGEKNPNNKIIYDIKRHVLDLNYQAKAPHPYLGYVYNRALGNSVNRDGFDDFSDFSDPYHQYFNIGIFGGSVAKDFAFNIKRKILRHQKNFVDTLIKKKPSLFKNKEPRVLNYAVSAFKQPQQLIASLLYLDKLDLIINIDGYNDVTGPISKEFPPSFPHYTNLFYSLDPERNQYWLDVYKLTKQRIYITKYFLKFDLSIVRLLWSLYYKFTVEKINFMQEKFKTTTDKKNPYYDNSEFNHIKKNKIKIFTDLWKKYTILQHQLLKINKVDYLHFIQPNQHVLKSKQLTIEEKLNFLNTSLQPEVTEAYRILGSMANNISELGYNIIDLTQLFKFTEETVYRDSCCHLNELGNNILNDTIEEKLTNFYEKKDNTIGP